MKHLYYALLLWATIASAQPADTTFVYLNNGCVDAYPADLATVGDMVGGTLEVTWNDNTIVSYTADIFRSTIWLDIFYIQVNCIILIDACIIEYLV
jgi:hypothetical protein